MGRHKNIARAREKQKRNNQRRVVNALWVGLALGGRDVFRWPGLSLAAVTKGEPGQCTHFKR